MLSVHQARRGLGVFLVSLVTLTFGSIWIFRRLPSFHFTDIGYYLVMMTCLSYSPALASLIARVCLREGVRDVSFRLGEWGWSAMVIGWLWPVVCGGVVFGGAWALGIARFQWTSAGYPYGSWGPETLLGLSIYRHSAATGLVVRLFACLLFAFVGCIQSFGEEVGWRGYMLTRLFDARLPAPIFWNGLVWGLWHIPFYVILASPPHPPEPYAVSRFFFVTGTIALAYLMGYLRLRSGSIWPSVLAHASMNSVLVLGFPAFTVANGFLKGELYLATLGLPMAALLLWRRPWIMQYWPQAGASS